MITEPKDPTTPTVDRSVTCSALPPVLDACCGSRMFWFDKRDPRGLFVDKRRESHTLPDISSKGGIRELVVDPDLQCDFTALPFPDASFALVVFDPPHFERNGTSGWVGLKYGTLKGDWREMLRAGFAECFRVLKPEGTLIFKWCADEISVSQILALTPERPLFGHKSGKQQKTHWITFLKANAVTEAQPQTNPGDVVLDPCMGSGTTCLAAKLEGRGYIGIEWEPKYFETAKTRIKRDAEHSKNAEERTNRENDASIEALGASLLRQDFDTIREIITNGGTCADILKFLDTRNA